MPRPNPSLDIDGFDTAHKATIMASLAYGEWFGMDPSTWRESGNITLEEITLTDELGYRSNCWQSIKQSDGNVEVRVHPTLIPKQSMLAKVGDVFNAVMVNGDFVGDTMFYGRGAGRNATASAVVADITDVCLNLKFVPTGGFPDSPRAISMRMCFRLTRSNRAIT